MKHTQCAKLLKALRRKRGVTSLEAALDLSITSLHRRLADLRALGVVIQAKASRNESGTRFNRYFATHVPEHLQAAKPASFLDSVNAAMSGIARKARG
jgi:DNA-binding IclR family transcriptional regulator